MNSNRKYAKTISNISGISQRICGISLINFRKFGHNFRTRKARKSIKVSKDSYYSLESHKALSHEIGSFDLLPRGDDVNQMQTKYAYI